MVPDFIVIGAQKAGTSSLYRHLLLHPQVRPACSKEIHFFDESYAEGMDWYRRHFPCAWAMRLQAWRCGARVVTGEASPTYVFAPHAAPRIEEHLPQARLICLVRDPVARAWSHYHHRRRRGLEHREFDDAIAAEEDYLGRLATGRDLTGLCLEDTYLLRGLYAQQLRRYETFRARGSLLVIPSSRFFAAEPEVLAEVTEFLGLQPFDWSSLGEALAPHNVGNYRERMPEATRERLDALFRPFNDELSEWLGTEVPWATSAPRAASRRPASEWAILDSNQ